MTLLLRNRHAMSYDTAWRQTRMLMRPDELVYRLHGHRPTRGTAQHDDGPS
ncbi:hypothetical protein [Streptomyces sp. ODS28]|uniref:hypothetical protein n=1 Tax=Streptomyces sp. ODS28 TaxID=3136688 RepID=UPI0031EDBBC6